MATSPARETCLGTKVFKKKKKRRARQYDDPVAVAGQLEHQHPARGGSTLSPESDLSSPPSYPGKPQREATVVERRQETVVDGTGVSNCLAQTAPTTAGSLTMEELVEGTLTEETLRSVARTQQLRDVTMLALVIDSSQTSIEGVWSAVPRLHTLTLDGSRLSSFRDLGVGLRNLNTLSLESSCVEDLDGIGALSGLRKLHLTRNRVSDVTPLACHSSLQVLGLESNRVSDMNALEILGTLPLLYSLDLRQNPLMHSLGKLIDGRGRGVVHQLVPQLRILDGNHLSGRGCDLAVDAQLLNEADDLICEGASRARAAWAEEDAAAEMAAENRWEREAVDGRSSPGSPSAASLRGRRRGVVVAAAVGVDGGGLQRQTTDRGMVHWDSDLTQGGRQALFGNPSSAIRRHKLGRDAGKRRNSHSHSPTGVLETLDLAKLTEQGLKHRHNQAADRVSEWRRETYSDSKPQEDVPALVSPAPSKKILAPVAPPPPSDPQSPGAKPRISPGDSSCERRGATTERSGRQDNRAGSGGRWGGGGGAKSPPMLASMSVSAVDVEDNRSSVLTAGSPGCPGRPWTTGGCGGGRDAPAETNPLNYSKTSEKSPRLSLKAQEGGKDVGGGGGHGRSRRQRPQTAMERSRRSGGSPEEPTRNNNSTSWQPVWESLKTAQLVSPTASKETAGEEGRQSEQAGARDDELVPLRNVDFRCQRRARTARKRTRSAGGRNGCSGERDNSLSAEEPEHSDESDEASYRNEVKRRASRFEAASGAASAASDGASCTPTRPALPQSPFLKPEASIGSGGGEAQPCQGSAQYQNSCADVNNLPPKARPKETATTMPSRRSHAAMDGSSSDDDSCVRKAKPPRNSYHLSGHRCGVDEGCGHGDASNDGVSNNGGTSNSGGDHSGSPTRRVSSVHASHALGFDLRKSLAAIDEWTDKTTAARDDSCSGAVGQGGATTTTSSPPVPCFVQRPERFTPSASKTRSSREIAKGFRHATDAKPIGGGAAPKTFAQTQIVVLGASTADDSSSEEDDGSEGEGVISIAAARAALGISKVFASTALAGSSSVPRPPCVSSEAARAARRPSHDAIEGLLAAEGGPTSTITVGGKSGGSAKSNRKGRGKRASSTPAPPGSAVGMSDEELRCMLRRQPRTVPELRTKDSFREFFQGMPEERMGRLLRGAYEGSLPADEVDKKVDKRLGLVGDLLAR